MIQDLHSHTYYSFCGGDAPSGVLQTAIENGIELFGICDHLYGIGKVRPGTVYGDREAFLTDYQRSLWAYLEHMRLWQEKVKDSLHMVCGVEIPTIVEDYLQVPESLDFSGFDYCLVEHLSYPTSGVHDFFAFAERLHCPHIGIAHTDLFQMLQEKGKDPKVFLSEMAKRRLFWEMNVNYDSIHGYKEHLYVKEFLQNPWQQELVRESGVTLSVGFDGHRVKDYRSDRVKAACQALEELELPLVKFDETQ